MNNQVVVITGASQGIGRAMATCFASQGNRVFDLSRHGVSADNITHLFCDVTNSDSVQEAIQTILNQESSIDLLICNAGFGIAGAVEFTKMTDAQQQFQVNFFGALTTVQAVLPAMRKQQHGRILFISSVAAVFSIPFQSFYSAAKSALNAMALALRSELAEYKDIQVSVLQLGDVSSHFTAARKTDWTGEQVYPKMRSSIESMERDEQTGMTPEYVAKRVGCLLRRRTLPPVYTIGRTYRLFVFLQRLLPQCLVRRIVTRMYQ